MTGATYTRTHTALVATAHETGLKPFDVRVILALHERGEEATSFELSEDLNSEGSQVRRSLLGLYEREMCVGEAADGGRRRPGTVTQVRLTPVGRAVVTFFYRHYTVLERAA
jgi:hypothetical protein